MSSLLTATETPLFVREYLKALDKKNPEAVDLLEFLPAELRGENWVRLLAHFFGRGSLNWDETNSEPLASVFRAVAPNGARTCDSSGSLYFLPLFSYNDSGSPEYDAARELGRQTYYRAEQVRQERGLEWYHPSRNFSELVKATLGGWWSDWEICFQEEGNVYKCCRCDAWSDSTVTTYDTEATFCTECAESVCHWSEWQGEYYERSYNLPDEDRNEDHLENHPLYGYNKETRSRFGSSDTGTFYGFELEIEEAHAGNDWDSHLELIPRNGLWLFHLDGSLNNGLELVTEPMSGDYIRTELDLSPLEKLRERGWRSWDTTTCGLHVHISRAGFASDVHTFAFAAFIYRNSAQMIKLAGRNSEQYATFRESERPALALDVKKRADYSRRYVAVNFQPEHTVECRFFRGSLNAARVRSALELVSGVVEYSRALTIRELNEGALEWSKFVEYLKQTPDYFPNLLELINKKGL